MPDSSIPPESISQKYFHPKFGIEKDESIINGKKWYNLKHNVAEGLKVVSYFTVLIPLGFLAASGIKKLFQKDIKDISKETKGTAETVQNIAQGSISSSNVEQTEKEKRAAQLKAMNSFIEKKQVPTKEQCEKNHFTLEEFEVVCKSKGDRGAVSGEILNKLGKMHEKNAGNEKESREKFNGELDKANEFYTLAAAEGSDCQAEALNHLGELILLRTRDVNIALEHFQKAAKKGSSEALNNIGKLAREKDIDLSQLENAKEDPSAEENLTEEDRKNKIAFQAFSEARDLGNANASNNIGEMHLLKLIFPEATEEESLNLAEQFFQEAVSGSQRDPAALNNLGKIAINKNTEEGDKAAFELFKEAAPNNIRATYNLGMMYLEGKGCSKNILIACRYFEEAADKDNKAAQYQLGLMHEQGVAGLEKNLKAAETLYKASGTLQATLQLGKLYRHHADFRKNKELAVEAFEKVLKEDPQNTEARIQLGDMYQSKEMTKIENQKEVPFVDYTKAYNYFEEAKKLGDFRGATFIGEMYREGTQPLFRDNNRPVVKKETPLPENDASNSLVNSALAWSKKTAGRALDLTKKGVTQLASSSLGNSVKNLLNHNNLKAVEHFQKAGQQGEPRALNNLGEMWLEGKIPNESKDELKAMQFFKLASEKGDARALNNLGEAALRGIGIEGTQLTNNKNVYDAMNLFEEASQKGDIKAYNNLGRLHEEGFGDKLDINLNKAIKFYTQSIERSKNKEAYEGLARCHLALAKLETIEGMKNIKINLAKEYFQLAVAYGSSNALNALGEMSHGTVAAVYYQEAIDKDRNPLALNNLGKIRRKQALLLRKEIGNISAKPPAEQQKLMEPVQELYHEAMQLTEEAANKGNAEAQCNLAEMKEIENRHLKDRKVAEEIKGLYEKSANQGNAVAEYKLGLIYKKTKQFQNKAFELFKSSSEKGSITGTRHLAEMYETAKGGEVAKLESKEALKEAKRLYEKVISMKKDPQYKKPDSPIAQKEERESMEHATKQLLSFPASL